MSEDSQEGSQEEASVQSVKEEAVPRPVQRIASRAVDVAKDYGTGSTAVRALDGVDMEFEAGKYAAIMGPSGSGKSTLLQCLAGLDQVTSGRIYLGDVDVTSLNEKRRTMLRRDKIGFIFQSFNLIPSLTAKENITLPMDLARRKPDAEWLNGLLDIVGLKDRLKHHPSELSGGEQQRVAAARALTSRPEIVFADEPTGNLDSKRSGEMLAFMRRAVKEFGQTIIMVTHDPIAASYSDQVVFLEDGKIVDLMEGPTVEKVLDRMKTLES
jgi:putative ABC transport system ATP-binding protein